MVAKKIGMACFIGGAVGTAVAFAAAPQLWSLGLLAGFMAGYLAYEFGEVLAAIPVALRTAAMGCHVAATESWRGIRWFFKPHPFLHQTCVIFPACVVLWFTYAAPPENLENKVQIFLSIAAMFGVCSTLGLHFVLALVGSTCWEKCIWSSPVWENREGYPELPLTYRNAFRWEAEGFLLTIWMVLSFLLWKLWYCFLKFVCQFFWHLFKAIHSSKRLLCGVDSAIGVMATYLYFSSSLLSSQEHAVVVFFGGCAGAVLGVLNWKLVSVRLLGAPESIWPKIR